MDIIKKRILLIIFTVLFVIGFFIILKSRDWDLGTFEAMHIAGSILCIFSGSGIMFELYKKK